MDLQFLAAPETWFSLLTLTVLEVVLGIDNIIFISILAGKLPPAQQEKGRLVGLSFALITPDPPALLDLLADEAHG